MSDLDELKKTWDAVFGECSTSDGKKISKAERNASRSEDHSLVYGEVAFGSLGEVFRGPHLRGLPPGGVFYDLGSGTGRGVVAAALLHGFDRCVGVEVLGGLHEAAVRVGARWDIDVAPFLEESRRGQRLEFVHASFLDEACDWSDASVVFANSTCFDLDLMTKIAARCERLREGAFVITLTKQLHSGKLRLVSSERQRMSWGVATVHIHRREDRPGGL